MHKYPIVRLPDDEPYRWWKLFPDTIVIHYGEALDTFLPVSYTHLMATAREATPVSSQKRFASSGRVYRSSLP